MSDHRLDHQDAHVLPFELPGGDVIEVSRLGSKGPPGLDLLSLGGASVAISLPPGASLTSVSCHLRFKIGGHSRGFQSTVRGYGAYAIIPEHLPALSLEAVEMSNGVLGHYVLAGVIDGVKHFTLWQGAHHDLLTFDLHSLEEAVDALALLDPIDRGEGITLREGAWTEESDTVTLEFGNIVANLRGSFPALVPPWPGRKGRFSTFYAVDDEGLAVICDGAMATLAAWDPDGNTLDATIDSLLDGFGITWRKRTQAQPVEKTELL